MMLRQLKLSMGVHVALEAGLRILAGINDETVSPPARFYVQASRSMTAFTTQATWNIVPGQMQSRMRARSKGLRIVSMAFGADSISHK